MAENSQVCKVRIEFMKISVIIPTLNEEFSIAKTLDRLARVEGVSEIIVVDGGSSDETIEIVGNLKAVKLVEMTGANRGKQLNEGTKYANGDVFWFVHADTRPADECGKQIVEVLSDERVVGGNFKIVFDGAGNWARFLSRLYPHLRKIGLVYGDSAFFVRREVYEKTGGFQDLPLFEDVDLYKKLIKYGRFEYLNLPVTTSSRRFENRSFLFTFARWSLFQGLYWLGFPPQLLAKKYEAIREVRNEKLELRSRKSEKNPKSDI